MIIIAPSTNSTTVLNDADAAGLAE